MSVVKNLGDGRILHAVSRLVAIPSFHFVCIFGIRTAKCLTRVRGGLTVRPTEWLTGSVQFHDYTPWVFHCAMSLRRRRAGRVDRFVITSGTGMGSAAPGALATEDIVNLYHPNPRVKRR